MDGSIRLAGRICTENTNNAVNIKNKKVTILRYNIYLTETLVSVVRIIISNDIVQLHLLHTTLTVRAGV